MRHAAFIFWSVDAVPQKVLVPSCKRIRDCDSPALLDAWMIWLRTQEGWPQDTTFVLEGYAYGAKYKAHDIGEVAGVVKLWAYQRGYEVHAIPPRTVKQYATGSGTAQKDAMVAAAEVAGFDLSVFPRKQDREDAADAYWVGRCWIETGGVLPVKKSRKARRKKK